MENILVSSFYAFRNLPKEELSSIRLALLEYGKVHSIRGLIIIAEEGWNGTFAGELQDVQMFKEFLQSFSGLKDVDYKDGPANKQPFRKLQVQIREEIVTFASPNFRPTNLNYLTPAEWEEALSSLNPPLVIDVRNHFEVKLGKFRGAVDPGISKFTELHDFLKKFQVAVDQEVLLYCTGGIRCEKAAASMQALGYKNVYQLQGGILAYLKAFPERNFEGECFVFDHRVALDQKLTPSKRYGLCPHCGDPGELEITCLNCGKGAKVCANCQTFDSKRTCSKNCAYHVARSASVSSI